MWQHKTSIAWKPVLKLMTFRQSGPSLALV